MPTCTIALGRNLPVSAEPDSAKKKRATESGTMVMPVWSALKPRTVCRYNGMTKNVPMMMNCWQNSTIKPARQRPYLQQSQVEAEAQRRRPWSAPHA